MGNAVPPAVLQGEATFWRRLSSIIVLVGLVLTAMVANLQQQASDRERSLLFQAEADRVTVALEEAINDRIGSFDSAINFVSATHPGSLIQYQDFMSGEVERQTSDDPGIMFFEAFELDEMQALEDREAAIGNDFTVTLLPSARQDRIILTRLSYDTDILGVSLLGLDGTGMSGELIPENFGVADFELYLLESAEIFRFVPMDAPDDNRFGQHSAVMLAPVQNRDGQALGWVVSIMTVSDLIGLDEISAGTDLEFTLRVDEFDAVVGASTGWTDSSDAESELQTVGRIETAGLGWDVDVRGFASYAGGAEGLLDQRRVWIGGLVLTALALLAAARRQSTRRRLDSARFELEHARTLASTDALTGLLNRNGLIDSARTLSGDHPATLFFIDLDGFKQVNDSDGHERGDQVLRTVANELRSIFRADDLVSRLGGDEFVVFARRSAPAPFVTAASKRITEAVSRIDERVTCSVGVSTRAAHSDVDVKDMLRVADAAMYTAKRSGGDRYEVAA